MKERKNSKILVGVDASRSVGNIEKTGVEKVSDELLAEMSGSPDIEFIYYTPRAISWLPENKQKVFGPKRLWTILGLSFEMLKNKPDVLFIPVHTMPFFCPKKTIKMIHDISFVKYKDVYSFWQRMYLNFDLRRAVRKCSKIVVPTQKVKKDLLKYTRVDEGRVIVVAHGYRPSRVRREEVKRKKQIIYIGRLEEKKNINNLVKGFEMFNKKYSEYRLVLAGKKGYGFDEANCQKIGVKCLGYISEEKKQELLNESFCLALVSKDEGFGIPVLEAFDFGLPVLASDIMTLREVGGEACMYVDPNSVESIAQGMEKLANEEALRGELVEKGKRMLDKFNWGKSAREILDIFIDNKD